MNLDLILTIMVFLSGLTTVTVVLFIFVWVNFSSKTFQSHGRYTCDFYGSVYIDKNIYKLYDHFESLYRVPC